MRFFRQHGISLVILALPIAAIAGWIHSSRFSERHLLTTPLGSVETFSSSSLFRISLVPSRKNNIWDANTFYRQPNARGKFVIRPLLPEFNFQKGLSEVTLGYWHLVVIGIGISFFAFLIELKQKQKRSAAVA